MTHQDERFMAAALRLGRRHLGQTGSNPSVANLLVQGEGENAIIVGQGITAKGGWPHAEALALAEAGDAAKGSTAYVTLEPCAHHGNTPPCVEALIEAGVARVVIPILDPNPLIAGKGIEKLQAAGIAVTQAICAQDAARDHAGHILRILERRPFVQLKVALTANGIAGRKGERLMVTGAEAQVFAQRLRTQCDAVLIGAGTVIADDPLLTCRLPGLENRSPRRFVFDRSLRMPLTAKLVQTTRQVPLVIMAGDRINSQQAAKLESHGVRIEQVSENGGFLANALKKMMDVGVTRVLLEGGPMLAAAFLEQDLVDEALIIESDKEYEGQDGIVGLKLQQKQRLMQSADFEQTDEAMLGTDRLRCFWRKRTCLQV